MGYTGCVHSIVAGGCCFLHLLELKNKHRHSKIPLTHWFNLAFFPFSSSTIVRLFKPKPLCCRSSSNVDHRVVVSLRTKNIAPSLLFKLRPSCQYVSPNQDHFVASVANYSKYSKIQSRICRIVPLFYKTIILELCKLQVRFLESKLFFGKSYPKLCLHTFKLKGLE